MKAMIARDSSDRPTINEVLAKFVELRSQQSSWIMHKRLGHIAEYWPERFVKSLPFMLIQRPWRLIRGVPSLRVTMAERMGPVIIEDLEHYRPPPEEGPEEGVRRGATILAGYVENRTTIVGVGEGVATGQNVRARAAYPDPELQGRARNQAARELAEDIRSGSRIGVGEVATGSALPNEQSRDMLVPYVDVPEEKEDGSVFL